jgi:SAM-dependent methyltransferase
MGDKENRIEEVLSPLTKSKNITLVDEFDVEIIKQKYKNEININVDRLFLGLKKVLLFQCNETKYRFYHPFSIIGDALFYRELSETRTNYYSQRWEHKRALNYLNTNDLILEVGSGFGAFISYLKNNNIENVQGIELNPLAIKKCQDLGYKVEGVLIEDAAIKYFEKYDAVCYFQVLEHITNVGDFIKSSLETLKKGGRLIIGVPNNNPYLFVNDKWHTLNLPPHHAGLWNKESLKALEKVYSIVLDKIEFEPLEMTFDYFIQIQLKDSNFVKKTVFKILNKFAPKLLKKVCCRFLKGRNVLAVFKKK